MSRPANGHFSPRELRLPALASQLRRARDYVSDAATAFGFDEGERYQFVFAANEAVTNAIKHGTPDDEGTIGLRISSREDRLTLDVWDYGQFTAPVSNGDLMPESGRGLELIATLMDDFEVTAKPEGTIVRLGKRRRTDNGGVEGDDG